MGGDDEDRPKRQNGDLSFGPLVCVLLLSCFINSKTQFFFSFIYTITTINNTTTTNFLTTIPKRSLVITSKTQKNSLKDAGKGSWNDVGQKFKMSRWQVFHAWMKNVVTSSYSLHPKQPSSIKRKVVHHSNHTIIYFSSSIQICTILR